MPTLGTDSWGRVRQSFADQFEPYGKDLIYRRFQNGKGIKVTSAEREPSLAAGRMAAHAPEVLVTLA